MRTKLELIPAAAGLFLALTAAPAELRASGPGIATIPGSAVSCILDYVSPAARGYSELEPLITEWRDPGDGSSFVRFKSGGSIIEAPIQDPGGTWKVAQFNAKEWRIAVTLATEGHRVERIQERPWEWGIRFADALVDGVRTEFKTVTGPPGSSTNETLFKNILTHAGRGRSGHRQPQASHIIIDARFALQSGEFLTRNQVQRGLYRWEGANQVLLQRHLIQSVRVMGKDFDVSCTCCTLAPNRHPPPADYYRIDCQGFE